MEGSVSQKFYTHFTCQPLKHRSVAYGWESLLTKEQA